jgi:superfamily I DNA and RNA helicase
VELFPSKKQFENDPAAAILLDCLSSLEKDLKLADALLYHNFPLYRDDQGGVIISDAMLLSPHFGVITCAISKAQDAEDQVELSRSLSRLEQVPPYIYSRLIRNKTLRKASTQLAFEIHQLLFAPLLDPSAAKTADDPPILVTQAQLRTCLQSWKSSPLSTERFIELVATIDGAKGIIRPSSRTLTTGDTSSKGHVAAILEASITSFDQQQKHGIMGKITGPQRLRGLAGSGKTVVLAMKAAQTHLQ